MQTVHAIIIYLNERFDDIEIPYNSRKERDVAYKDILMSLSEPKIDKNTFILIDNGFISYAININNIVAIRKGVL